MLYRRSSRKAASRQCGWTPKTPGNECCSRSSARRAKGTSACLQTMRPGSVARRPPSRLTPTKLLSSWHRTFECSTVDLA